MPPTTQYPRAVAEAMEALGVAELAPGARPHRVEKDVVFLSCADGRKRAYDTKAGKEVDPRTGRPLGEAAEAAKGTGGLPAKVVRMIAEEVVGQAISPENMKKIVADAVKAATDPLAARIRTLEEKVK